ncbi:hypothetical protein CJ469_02155 [Nocardia farcinica]|uniref:hypothetical protein n=1 Tax=Nocardia farcinica TaxID=37329 RepID=UPI000BF9D31C|nr:hypothetical protein [Nocardia farcinica]PFX04277.1 hypothetical protein CJ469_02155 [Nocardia farcinica]PFX06511.1 hypothetical protein CJ468_04439 [Nocardia farcinica]
MKIRQLTAEGRRLYARLYAAVLDSGERRVVLSSEGDAAPTTDLLVWAGNNFPVLLDALDEAEEASARAAELETQQPRTIQHRLGVVDALPPGSQIVDDDGVPALKVADFDPGVTDGDGYHSEWITATGMVGTYDLAMPVRVLHIPTAEARDGEPAMASDRDTPAALPRVLHRAIDQSLADLFTDWDLSQGLPAPVTVAVHIERDLRAAGWRPPAREITDPEELDALPVGSIVREIGVDAGRSLAWYKCVNSRARAPFCWEEFGTPLRSQSSEISLPVIVLWTPSRRAGDEVRCRAVPPLDRRGLRLRGLRPRPAVVCERCTGTRDADGTCPNCDTDTEAVADR